MAANRAVGYQQAFRMAAEAKRVTAEECLSFGICSEVVEDGKVFEETLSLHNTMLVHPMPLAKQKA